MAMIPGYRGEPFKIRDHKWTRYHATPAKSDDCWIMGVDVGQSVDPTAVSICHHTRTVVPWSEDDGIIDHIGHTVRQRVNHRYAILFAERVALKVDYRDIILHLRELWNRAPLSTAEHRFLVIDEGGVGRAVADELGDVRPVRVFISAGADVHKLDGERRFSVPKEILTGALDIAAHLDQLKIPEELAAAPQLAEEFRDYRRSLTATNRATYGAKEGARDDLIIATALAIWWAGERYTRLGFCHAGPLRGLV